ncbi:MAG: serine hydrolase [Anaerolineae bacterium]|nr:serine hydrolase [Anaerolineae bacterium]
MSITHYTPPTTPLKDLILATALLIPFLFFITTGLSAAQEQADGQAYTVQATDTLSSLAEDFYQNYAAWPAIQMATNAKAAQDSRFSPIENSDQLSAGQLIWIPSPAEAERLLGGGISLGPPELKPLTPDMLAEFETFVETARQRFRIPGAAVVVVQGNQIAFAKGFGVRQLGQPDPVTPETIFPVGSTTKAMTSMLMATLVDEGKLDWDQPVVEVWPDFKLSDPAITPQIRIRHLLNMSSGVPRVDLVWSGAGLTAEQVMASLAELEVVTTPGEVYHYNNQIVATGGYVGALAAGGQYGNLAQSYSDLLQARIFDPIGMSSATTSIDSVQAQPNHATPHDFTLSGEVIPTHFHADPGIAPAGAVNASALDMARFVMTELGEGVAPDGNRVVSAANLAETWQPAVKVTKTLSYGMGWFIEDFRGIQVIWHDGDVLGSKAMIVFVPEANIGLVVLTNRTISTGFSYSVRYHLLNLLYGLEFEQETHFETQWDEFLAAIAAIRAKLNPLVDPAAVAPYLGDYEGSWRVELRDDNTLWAVRGPYGWQLMQAENPDEFVVNNGFGLATPLQFVEDETTGDMLMTFTLTSGEEGSYRRLSP